MTNTPIETPLEDIEKNVQDSCSSTVEITGHALSEGKPSFRTNPIPLILGAFGIGLAVAFLLPKPERSHRERYLDDPLDELKKLLHAASQRAGHTAQETCDNTSSAMEKSLKRLKGSLSSFLKV